MYHDIFIRAITDKVIVELWFDSVEKGNIIRRCIPFDFGTSRRYKDGKERYHFLDIDSPEGNHNLSILPNQVIKIILLEEVFEPADYVKWSPKWNLTRDWGPYS